MWDIGFVPYIWQNIFIFLSNLHLRPMLLCSSTLYLHLSCKFPISIFGITPPPIRKWMPYRVAHTIYMTTFSLSVFIFHFFFVILSLVLFAILFYLLFSLSYSTSLPLCPSSTKVNGKWYGGKMDIPAYDADYTYYITFLLLFPYFNHCNFLSLSVFFFLLYFLFQLPPSCFFPFFYFLSLSSFFFLFILVLFLFLVHAPILSNIFLVLIFTRRNKITKRKYKYENRIHIHNMEQKNK